MSGDPSALRQLAARVGILSEYLDQTGTEVRQTSDETRIAILRAMGIEASTPEAAAAASRAMDEAQRAELLPPVRVTLRGSAEARRIELRIPSSDTELRWEGSLTTESGAVHRFEGRSRPGGEGHRVRIRLPERPPEGYHEVGLRVTAGGREREAGQTLIVVPRRARRVRPVFGVIANLYTVRTERDWGVGDLSSLGALLEWTAEQGGGFVGVNPLHALRNRGWDVSPYSPVSRLFRNPIYLDPAAVPAAGSARALLDAPEVRAEQAELRAAPAVQYERVAALKRTVLQRLYEELAVEEEFRPFRDAHGEPLERFATFEALVDVTERADWREWPAELQDPRSPAVARFRAEHARLVDYHRWVQFELDRQLAAAADRGRRAGLAIGLYQDLAIGTAPGGADVWANPELFLRGVSIGAPPDDLGPSGQNWGLPPVSPRTLRDDRYRFWIRLLRASLAHAGALRIDHVLGLFRQFWIPDGMHGSQGAYVRFPSDDLLGILLLEARRHEAVVVGEDLGTVPPEVPPALRARGILSSRVFYFERDGMSYRPAAAYEPAALATANTHDLPPIAGYWDGRDIQLRRAVGAIASDEAADHEWQARHAARQGMLERLAAEGELPSPDAPADPAELRGAVHQFLCRSPAAMVGFSLDDLVGETEPVNLPGVPPDLYPSWTRRLGPTIESLSARPEVRTALRCGPRGSGRRRPSS